MPAASLDVDNSFNIKANNTKPGDFFLKITQQQFGMTCHCPRDLTFPWKPYFDRQVSFKISICLILKLNKSRRLVTAF